jgi:starch synthase
MKSAIDYSDSVTTVSNTYAGEIMRAEYAHGLESILLKNAYKLKGILNGIDTDVYNPSTNPSLFRPYDASNVDTEKARNKTRLQKMLGLQEDKNVPVVAMISRLVSHKGVDLVRSVFRDIMNEGAQFIILGTGDADHESFFQQMEEEYGEKVRAVIAFNKDMAQKIYAGADIFLMPSKSEPCGLSQMMAMRYGTIPVVRATGGLKDSVTDCGNGDGGTGFVFENYNADELRHAMARAIGLYRDYFDKWVGLRKRAMASDFSWKRSAKEYLEFYNEL